MTLLDTVGDGTYKLLRYGNVVKSDTISVSFNLARLYESQGEANAAASIHKAIIRLHPNYINSYLRLACIAKDHGKLKDCSDWLSAALKVAPQNPEILGLIGSMYMDGKDWEMCQSTFERVLDNKDESMTAYSKLSLGNIYFANIKTPGKNAKNLKHAAAFYKMVLEESGKTNLYAANGIGVVMAEKGELLKAKDVFNRVRDASGDNIECVLVNLGHILVAQGKHSEGIRMYEKSCGDKKAQL